MISLFIDTSTTTAVVALYNNEKSISIIKEENMKDISSHIMPMIDNLFNNNNLRINQVDKIFVVNGPGSFTGLRIGVTIAKTLAWSLNIPVVPISSLEVLATTSFESDYIIPYIDARRDFAFAAIYDTENSEFVMTEKYISRATLEVIMENLPGEITYISNDPINTDYNIIGYNPNILNIVLKNYERPSVNPHAIDANYLKLTEAEEKNDNRDN